MAYPEQSPKPAAPGLHQKKIGFLLVDDDSICQFIHQRVLELSGYNHSAQFASNGKVALDMLLNSITGSAPAPDIILLDLEMPIMNGMEFLEAFNQIEGLCRERIAIVLLSSSESPDDRNHAKSLGVKHCMSKPLTNEKLDDLISMLYPPDPSWTVMVPVEKNIPMISGGPAKAGMFGKGHR